MDDHLEVEAARIPDRDRLLAELREAGVDAHPVDEVGIEVRVGSDAQQRLARSHDFREIGRDDVAVLYRRVS